MDSVSIYTFLVICLAVYSHSDDGVATSQFKLTNIKMCDPSVDYPLTITKKLETKGDKQFLSGKSIFKVNFGEDSDFNVTIKMKKTKDESEFAPLMSFYEEETCQVIDKYLGDFVVDIEKMSGIEPGKCPIAKGTYTLNDYPLDFSKVEFQSIPEGVLQATQVITNKKTKEVLMCVIMEGENFPKE